MKKKVNKMRSLMELVFACYLLTEKKIKQSKMYVSYRLVRLLYR